MVFVLSPCAVACISICAHVTISKSWQTYQLLGHTTTLYTLVGMGSAAIVAAAALITQVWQPQYFW